MHQIQEVIRLHRLGRGQRAIARQLRMGRDTIRTYQEKLEQAGLLHGSPDDLPDIAVLQTMIAEEFSAPSEEPNSSVDAWKMKISKLHKAGVGPTAIHDHLRLQIPDYTGHLSSVKRMCNRLSREEGPKATDVAIRVETAPGDVAQVDFGYAGLRYDPGQGVLRKCWVFVMTLGLVARCSAT